MRKIISFFVILIFLQTVVSSGIPNPAAVKCGEEGYKIEMRVLEDGSQYGVCVFEDSECGQWKYFRGECKPEQCNRVEGYMLEGEFKLECEPYEKESRFASVFKKYFFLIFAWLWIEDEEKEEASWERALKEEIEL
ncbi:MAG: DUF333 domain-containing protein [Nanoarchaeota archaeon]|nr:DUF333 domain-containing protein [Nanoarchaeota archaeon]